MKLAPISAQAGRATTIKGTVKDLGGLAGRLKLAFGDGKSASKAMRMSGAFRFHHTYRRNGTYRLRVTVSDRSGNRATRKISVSVRG